MILSGFPGKKCCRAQVRRICRMSFKGAKITKLQGKGAFLVILPSGSRFGHHGRMCRFPLTGVSAAPFPDLNKSQCRKSRVQWCMPFTMPFWSLFVSPLDLCQSRFSFWFSLWCDVLFPFASLVFSWTVASFAAPGFCSLCFLFAVFEPEHFPRWKLLMPASSLADNLNEEVSL